MASISTSGARREVLSLQSLRGLAAHPAIGQIALPSEKLWRRTIAWLRRVTTQSRHWFGFRVDGWLPKWMQATPHSATSLLTGHWDLTL
jgi:hypothetical protein